ncbi:FtsX-like permease family protein [Primorskyibacter sp. S87]|uniref:FtsX-like permease family protein n=1 Tax=Primorskyibacter sp. S87 TaxID=3415126 RepID=UPI003C7ECD4C
MTGAAMLALLSHWRRHPIQLLTLLAGLALATGLWSAVQAINGEARASYAAASAQLGSRGLAELHAPSGAIPLSDYVGLRRSGWQVSPILDERRRINNEPVRILGVDLLSHPPLPALAQSEDTGMGPLETLTDPGRIFLHPDLARKLDGVPDLPPMQVTRQVPPGTLLTDIGVAERLLDMPGRISRILVLPEQPAGLEPLERLAPGLIMRASQGSDDAARLTDSFHLNLTAFGLLSFAVGLFIVHGTVGLVFEQRRGTIRTLRALGLSLRRVALLLTAELLTLALLAGALGLMLGFLVAAALLPDVAASLRGLYGAPVEGGLHLRPVWLASGLAMALAGTLLASAQAMWRLTRMPLLQPSASPAWTGKRTRAHLAQACLAAALIGIGLSIQQMVGGLLAGFALLAGVMLGAALLLPPFLFVLLGVGQRTARGVIAEWLWADTRAQLPGLSLALMALLLALATNIGVGTMVSSFRLTFTGWLDQRLVAELYVTARDDREGAQIAQWLSEQGATALPNSAVEISHQDRPLFVHGIVDHSTYREHWPLIADSTDVWDRLAAGQAILINEQLARHADLWPGSEITIMPGWTLPVAGVYSDYGNPTGQAIVAFDALIEHVPQLPTRRYAIRIDPAHVAELGARLLDTFDLPGSALVDQAAVKAESMRIFDKTFVITGALNVLTLGVAAFAILTSLLTLWTMRLPQLAPVWALGSTQRQLAWLEICRALLLSALTALLALPLGLVLAWVLLAVINVEAFGWRLPMHQFPLDWLRLFLLALAAGALAAALPALRLHKMPPAQLLKVFSSDG